MHLPPAEQVRVQMIDSPILWGTHFDPTVITQSLMPS